MRPVKMPSWTTGSETTWTTRKPWLRAKISSTSALSAYSRFVKRTRRARASASRPCKRVYSPIISAGKLRWYRSCRHSSRATIILYPARTSVLLAVAFTASHEYSRMIAMPKTLAWASQESENFQARKTATMKLVVSVCKPRAILMY